MKPTDQIPPPPPELLPAAAQLWNAYAAELHSREMLETADLPALTRLCILEAQAADLTAEIADKGPTYEDKDGNIRRNPAILALVNLSGLIDGLKRSLSLGGYYRTRKEFGAGKKPEPERPVSRLMKLRQRPTPGAAADNE